MDGSVFDGWYVYVYVGRVCERRGERQRGKGREGELNRGFGLGTQVEICKQEGSRR